MMPPPREAECVSRLSEILSAEQAALRQQLDRVLEERFLEIARRVGAELEALLARARPPGAPEPWAALPIQEQRLHLAAQRFARVQVARMLLEQGEAVARGRRQANLYDQLRDAVESAREKFRQEYLTSCPSMPDYLHLELVRVLGQDDPARMGPEYPGPLV
jgi:hypothetical protein